MKRFILLSAALLSFDLFAQATIQDISLSKKDSAKFFNRLKALSTATGIGQYRMDFFSQDGAFRMQCGANVIAESNVDANCSIAIDDRLAIPGGTQVALGRSPNILYVRFNAADSAKLSTIRKPNSSGVVSSEKKILAYKPTLTMFARFGIKCEVSGEQPSCYAVSVVDCMSPICGKP